MPTNDEMKELMDSCQWTWTTLNGIKGYAVSRGKVCVFLPASGYREGPGGEYGVGDIGRYLSSEILSDNPIQAYCIYLAEDRPFVFYYHRTSGYSVRPVYDPNFTMVSSITLDETSLTLIIGESQTVSATILPDNATYKSVSWSSSDDSVATVDANGKIAAVSKGTATITATPIDGTGFYASCTVRVMSHAKPEGAVDLGLSIYWASCNVGASYPEDYGIYVGWGEVQSYYSSLKPLTWRSGKEAGYDWSSYRWCSGSYTSLTKYNTNESNGIVDNLTTLELNDDVANCYLGGYWRMPTLVEWRELREKCTLTWHTQDSMNGALITGPNGNTIFLPAGGEWYGTTLSGEDRMGEYWSSSLKRQSTENAYYIEFYYPSSPSLYWEEDLRIYGKNIRPVFD